MSRVDDARWAKERAINARVKVGTDVTESLVVAGAATNVTVPFWDDSVIGI